MIFLQQGGKNQHEHICESLEKFHTEVYDEFAEGRDVREARKAEELAREATAGKGNRKEKTKKKKTRTKNV